ncbi:MAG: hypothetical protein IPJ17_10400 [Holophagales bacterium]|jgi:hypothetical protein|nr:MAG: hypothetical protein IPJ17_10400 [Holophagales bacterium]
MSPSPFQREANRSAALSTDLDRADALVYFSWDEPTTVEELHAQLQHSPPEVRDRLLARILREARDTDVWKFTTLAEVVARWDEIAPQLGRRRDFWEFLLRRWRDSEVPGEPR